MAEAITSPADELSAHLEGGSAEEPTAVPVPGPSTPDLVTVLIPSRNEAASIEACLDSVLAQDYANLQVVVVDSNSSDGTAQIVLARGRVDSRVELVSHSRKGIPQALNAGLAAARGRWLVRVDAHSSIGPDYVSRAAQRLREGRWVGVGGRKDAVADTPTGRAIAAVLASPLAVGGSVYHHGTAEQEVDHIPFGAYPTDLLRAVGGWREDIANNEDFEMDQRLRGHGSLLFDPSLRIAWQCRESVAELFKQYRRYGTGKPAVARAHPRSVRVRHLAPPALVAWLALAAVLLPVQPLVAGLMLLPYALAIGLASALILRRLPAHSSRRSVPAALLAMQVGWGVGFWQGLRAASTTKGIERAAPA